MVRFYGLLSLCLFSRVTFWMFYTVEVKVAQALQHLAFDGVTAQDHGVVAAISVDEPLAEVGWHFQVDAVFGHIAKIDFSLQRGNEKPPLLEAALIMFVCRNGYILSLFTINYLRLSA